MIIDYKWYWSKRIWSIEEYDIISWAVLYFSWNNFYAFIWVWTSWDEDKDIEEIRAWWNKISKQEALGIFWNVEYNWFTLENNYWLT